MQNDLAKKKNIKYIALMKIENSIINKRSAQTMTKIVEGCLEL